MTDDALDQIPEPTPAEARALAVLDRRGRRAAASLTSAVSAHLADSTDSTDSADFADPVDPEPAPRRAGAPAAIDDVPLTVDLSAGRARRSRASARPWWLAAAAVATVVGLVAGVTLQGDERPGTSSGGGEYLVAGWLPDGFAPTGAVDVAATMTARHPSPEIAVYGDGEAADPWTGPTVSVAFVPAPAEELPSDLLPDRETIVVGDDRATLIEQDGLVVVERAVDGGTLAVVGDDRMARDEVVAAAAAATVDPTVPAGALPPGFAEIARGPLSAAGSAVRGLFGFDGDEVLVAYERGEGAQGGDPSVAVFQRPGSPPAVDLARLHQDASWVTEVRGERAVGATSSDTDAAETTLQWLEPTGMLVTIVGTGVSGDDLARLAEGLRPAEAGEIAALLQQHEREVASPAEAGDEAATTRPLEEDQTEVATGVQDGEPWRLLATRRPGYAALDLAYGTGSAGMGWADAGPLLPLEVSWSQSAGWPAPVLIGVVADGATVTVEVPGRPPLTPELVALPGWDHHGFVAFVPGVDGFEVVVVARGPDGQEVARDSQPVIAPPAPEDGPPPAAPEDGPPD